MERGQLWQAIKSNNLALVKMLINKGVDINSVSGESEKALHQITDSGALQAFRPRLGNEIDHKAYGRWEKPALHNSDQHSNLEIDKKENSVSCAKVEPMTKKEQDGLSGKQAKVNRGPVETAIQYGRSEIVQVLLQAGAKISVEYLASLPFRSLTEEKERIWTILCKERPVESVCVMILAQSNTEQDEGIWLPLFNDLLQQEKVEVLICLCKVNALMTVEWFLHKKFFCHSEIKEVLRNVLYSSYTVNRPQIVKCLLTQDIILSEKDFDPLMACLKLQQTDLVQKFLEHVPCLHLWNEDICKELILVALKSDDCTSLEVLVRNMGSGVINSISLSSVIDICVKDRKGMTLKSKMEHLLNNGYLVVDWDYLDLFETLTRRKRFEQLKVVLSLLPLPTILRRKDHFLKIAIKTRNVELVKKIILICEESTERNFVDDEFQGLGKVQDIYKNWHKVRYFKQFYKTRWCIWSAKKNNHRKQVKSPFHLAVRTGHLELVKLFSAKRFSVTVLRDAVQHTQIFEYLMPNLDKEDTLKRKAICKAANCKKNTLELLLNRYKWQNQAELDRLLEQAIKCEKGDIVTCLLEKNAKLRNENKDHLLNLSLKNVKVLSFVIKQEIMAVDEKNCDGVPLLFLACSSGNIDAVEILLSCGASPNIIFKERTPLLLAVEKDDTELVKFLLNHPEIEVDKSDVLGVALDSCNTHIIMKILESLKKTLSPQSPTSWAIEVLEIMEKLLTKCNRPTDSEMTDIAALITVSENEAITLDVSRLRDIILKCIEWNLIHLTEFLLQLGFKANNEVCSVFIMKTVSHGSLKMLHVLLKYLPLDALPERVIRKPILQQVISRFKIAPVEPLKYGSEEGLLKNVLQLILDKGGDLYLENHKGETALSCAARIKNYVICEFVIQKGYHSAELVKQYAIQCESAFKYAVLNYDLPITKLMIKSGFINGPHSFIVHHICLNSLEGEYSSEMDLMIKYMLGIGVMPPKAHKLAKSGIFVLVAVKYGYFQFALNLLNEGYSPMINDGMQNSPLHLVSQRHSKQQNEDECTQIQFINKFLEKHSSSVNRMNAKGMTPLLCAVMNKDAALVQILLDRGSECDTALPQSQSTYPGCTALHIACQTHQYNIVNTLLKAGASVTKRDARKRTALHCICMTEAMNERPPYEIVQYLVHAGAKVMDPDLANKHPTYHAVQSNLFGIVHFLLSHDDNDKVSYQAIYNLMECSYLNTERWEKTVECLFRKVGDSKMKCILSQSLKHKTAGKDIFSLCVAAGSLSLYHTIVTLGKGEHQMNSNTDKHLHFLIRSKSVDMTLLHYILERGADVNEVNNEGRTPAHVACEHNQIKVLEILFNYGANINVQDAYGWTPIHVCMMNHAEKCLTFLLQHSECVNQTTTAERFSIFAGSTALMVAIISYPTSEYSYIHGGYKSIINVLLKHGANPNIADIKGNNAFHIAVVRKLPIILVTKLVKRMRDINVTNKKHQSALHLALIGDVGRVKVEMIEFLLQEGCNPNLRLPKLDGTKEGDTVLHLAVRGLRRDLTEVFLRCGLDIFVKNSAGESPVSLCFEEDNYLPLNKICFLDLLLKAGATLPCLDITEHFYSMAIDQQLLQFLFECSCKIRLNYFLEEDFPMTEEQKSMLELIRYHRRHTLSLRLLSASAVRCVLKPNALYSVEKLPMPLYLKNIFGIKQSQCTTARDNECLPLFLRNTSKNSFYFEREDEVCYRVPESRKKSKSQFQNFADYYHK